MSCRNAAVIVTFKKKDTRANPEPDKLELLSEAVGEEFSVAGASYGPLPRGLDLDRVVYDVDEYEAPIVVATLDDDQIDAVRGADDVATVEEDGPMFALGELVIEGQPSVLEETVPAGVAAIKAPAAWDASRGKAIKVAVLDTGIAPAHPDLVANLRTGMSFVSTETSTDDFNGHGTHVAGTIAAAHDQMGVVGVAPAAALYAVKVLDRNGRGQWSNLIAGIDWCINAQDIRILNMSLGGPRCTRRPRADVCPRLGTRPPPRRRRRQRRRACRVSGKVGVGGGCLGGRRRRDDRLLLQPRS